MKKFFEMASTTKVSANKLMDKDSKALYTTAIKQAMPALYNYASKRFNAMTGTQAPQPVDKDTHDMAMTALSIILTATDTGMHRSVDLLDKISWTTLVRKGTPVGDLMFAISVENNCKEVLKGMRDKYGTKLNGINEDAYMKACKDLEEAEKARKDLETVPGNYKWDWTMTTSANPIMKECDNLIVAFVNQQSAKSLAEVEAEAEERRAKRRAARKAKKEAEKAAKAEAQREAAKAAQA